MEMSVREIEGVTLIALRGRLDLQGVSAIELKFNDTARARNFLIIDLSGVTYIASMGMRMLLVVGKTMATRKGKDGAAGPVKRSRHCFANGWRGYRYPCSRDRGRRAFFPREGLSRPRENLVGSL